MNELNLGVSRLVSKEIIKDRGHSYMLKYFEAINNNVIFEHEKQIGRLIEIGEDDHDYWIKVAYENKEIRHSPLERWSIVK